MIEKDFRILRRKCLVSLKCHSLKDYFCVWFGCHLVVFKGKADFRNWSLYPLREPKWAELKGIWGGCWQLCSGGLLSPLHGDSLPGSCRVTLISVLLARLKVGERDELPRREERGNYPAARRQPPWPCIWMGCVQACDIQAVGAHPVGLCWVGKWPGFGGGGQGEAIGGRNGLQEDAHDLWSLQGEGLVWCPHELWHPKKNLPGFLHLPPFISHRLPSLW